ncbi:MAG: hypothetical protein ACM3NJ_00050 [Methanobacterium sp.]
MKLFKGKNQAACPVCGRRAGENDRYCSECYTDEPRGVMHVSLGQPKQNMEQYLFWIAAVLVGVILIGAAYIAWSHFNTQTTTTENVTSDHNKIDPVEVKSDNGKNDSSVKENKETKSDTKDQNETKKESDSKGKEQKDKTPNSENKQNDLIGTQSNISPIHTTSPSKDKSAEDAREETKDSVTDSKEGPNLPEEGAENPVTPKKVTGGTETTDGSAQNEQPNQ